jgi:molybdopterin molybdotransferase
MKKRDVVAKEVLIEYEEALSRVMAAAKWKLPSESVSLGDARGRTLREDVKSGLDIPPFNKSAMDGYAVVAGDTALAGAGAPARLEVLEDLPAGKSPSKQLKSGQASRIMTGAPLPQGADAVVMVEDTERQGKGGVLIKRPVHPGDNVGERGEDVRKGQIVLQSGERLGPASVGMLASMGRARVKVTRAPVVAVISTGDEIEPPGKALAKGRIYDANGYALTALASSHGSRASFLGIARDRPGELGKKLDAVRDADVVLLTGGVSVGDYDLVVNFLRGRRVREVFYKSRVQPGKPTFCGVQGKRLYFGLPGNPVSALVCFHLFVRPALDKICGRMKIGMSPGRAVLETAVKARPGRRKFLRGSVISWGPALTVRPYPRQKSGILSSMMGADVLIDVPGESSGIKAGTEVKVWWIGEGDR